MQDLRTFLSGMFVVAAVLTLIAPLAIPALVNFFPAPATFAARAMTVFEFGGSIIGGVAALWLGRRR